MKGLIIWARSTCRSALATYCELGKAFGVPFKICMLYSKCEAGYTDSRILGGMAPDEFPEIEKEVVGYGIEKGMRVLDSHPGWHHLFCLYQREANYRTLLLEAVKRGCRCGIMSESPCVMVSGWRGLAKRIYLKTLLPWRVRDVIKAADFFVNYSGDDPKAAMAIGWPRDKIIPFGYFMQPVPNSRFVERMGNQPFEIMSSGQMTWHRGCDVLIEALSLLHKRGVKYHATVTQKGPLFEALAKRVKTEKLPVDLVGFVQQPDLIRLYETCSVYVGAGRSEPWGMRLNEALMCGAPLVVSRGMGGVQMIDQYHCGLAFDSGDAPQLADCLEQLATNSDAYLKCSRNAKMAAEVCSPRNKALDLLEKIRTKNNWRTKHCVRDSGIKGIG